MLGDDQPVEVQAEPKLERSAEDPEMEGTSCCSTSLRSSSPRSQQDRVQTTAKVEDEIVVVFATKEEYMDQCHFDDALRAKGVEEEVLHRIARVEARTGETVPEPEWDDPGAELFPVQCVYVHLPSSQVRAEPLDQSAVGLNEAATPPGNVSRSREASVPSSMPTTPELTIRELPCEQSPGVATSWADNCQFAQFDPSSPTGELDWYRVVFIGGISVRVAPDVAAPCTGFTLPFDTVFAVSQSFVGLDQRVYLRLADGCGWVFDDSVLMPADPSVLKLQPAAVHPMAQVGGQWAQSSDAAAGPVLTTVPLSPAPSSSSAPVLAMSVTPPSRWYRVECAAGLAISAAPDYDALSVGDSLPYQQVFEVSEAVFVGREHRLYMKLSDGRGWVFDDALCAAYNRSVVPIYAPQYGAEENSKDKRKTKEQGQGHVPYWVRLRRAKLLGLSKPQSKKKS